MFQVYLNKKVFLFIQYNKNMGEKIFWVVRQNILTLLNVFSKLLVAFKIKQKKRKFTSFQKGENGWFVFFKNAFFLEHKHFLKCDLDLLIFFNLIAPKRPFFPQIPPIHCRESKEGQVASITFARRSWKALENMLCKGASSHSTNPWVPGPTLAFPTPGPL